MFSTAPIQCVCQMLKICVEVPVFDTYWLMAVARFALSSSPKLGFEGIMMPPKTKPKIKSYTSIAVYFFTEI